MKWWLVKRPVKGPSGLPYSYLSFLPQSTWNGLVLKKVTGNKGRIPRILSDMKKESEIESWYLLGDKEWGLTNGHAPIRPSFSYPGIVSSLLSFSREILRGKWPGKRKKSVSPSQYLNHVWLGIKKGWDVANIPAPFGDGNIQRKGVWTTGMLEPQGLSTANIHVV